MVKLFIATSLFFYSIFLMASPKIIAHRGGAADAPENTEIAIKTALNNQADAIWITLQLSKDNIPVLYRPSDLKNLTNGQGVISQFTAEELAKLDAGYQYGEKQQYPYRNKGITIPTLEYILTQFPNTQFYLDLKSPDADPAKQGNALATVLNRNNALHRTRVYSTNTKFLDALPDNVQRFESRDVTRDILANITMGQICLLPENLDVTRWYGLELHRKVEVVEKYTLGEAKSASVLSWNKDAMSCFRAGGNAHIVLFGINTEKDYDQATQLGADAVMVDSPANMKSFKKD
ncbi:glycerophosphodiester phosphodiesterase family protein [Proteus hauseri]|uniref:glycerophosphodiester phosphodiesterase family protein n=1 Tax=Proteus hauseri TaxID=183417 RepID=UPI0010094EEB|nr:glycerophosphodiester phosphodiesterase family protein [Proteus hauseri]QAV23934.1 glycerophosphodiester phosphodiesterase [Proteus hauseri]